MAGEIDSLMRDAHTKTEPSFAVAFRGYARRQVEQYARTIEAQIGAVLTVNNDLEAQVKALTIQVRMAHDEIGDLRRRPPSVDNLAYRHLGARVEQILSEAEQEATTIRQSAIYAAEQERNRLADALNEARAVFEREAQQARDEREQARRDLVELRALHADQERDMLRRLEATRAELVRAEAAATRQRSDAAELLTAAQDAYDRLHASAMANAETVQADLDVRMRELRARAYEEASSVALAAEIYALETVSAAEEYAANVHGTDIEDASIGDDLAGELLAAGAGIGKVGARHAKNDVQGHSVSAGHNGARNHEETHQQQTAQNAKAQRHAGNQSDNNTQRQPAIAGSPQQPPNNGPAKPAAGRDLADESPSATAKDTPTPDAPTDRVSSDDTPDLISGAA
jgi:cell division septum initiation protein DivIVA